MVNGVIDIKKRFSLKGTESLKSQVENFFGQKPIRIMTQLDMFPGYDELDVLLKSGIVFRCLVTDGEQVSDWIEVKKGDQQ